MGWILRSSTHPLLAGSQRWEIGNARPFSSVAADRFLRFPLLVEQDSSPSDEPESSGESEGMLFPFVAHQAVRKRSEVEAVLFLAREPLSSGKIAQLASISGGNEVRKLVRTLNRHYDRRHRAVRIVEVAGGFQLRTRPQFAPWLRRWMPESVEIRLTQPAFETLAVVAYLQPVLRATVEKIRGVRCTDFLRQLMEMDLVKITGRQEELGRPFLYGTTRGFLQTFGLKNLDDLPRREQMRRFAS
jgi:segregation and condensation protein B